jgi:hypothetical protein
MSAEYLYSFRLSKVTEQNFKNTHMFIQGVCVCVCARPPYALSKTFFKILSNYAIELIGNLLTMAAVTRVQVHGLKSYEYSSLPFDPVSKLP